MNLKSLFFNYQFIFSSFLILGKQALGSSLFGFKVIDFGDSVSMAFGNALMCLGLIERNAKAAIVKGLTWFIFVLLLLGRLF